jgi:outer membrane protein assembly factor BamB
MDTRHAHGEGSSPALHGDTLVVNWDHQGESFIVALNKDTGETLWKQAREEITSWSTPLIVEHDGRAQVIVSATHRIRSYDLKTGDLIWECGGLSRNVVASPVSANGIVFAGNSYDRQAMLAIRLAGARGDITGTDNVIWQLDRMTPYVPSPLLDQGTLYFLRHNQGVLSGHDLDTGESRFDPIRLPGLRQAFASPVAAAGRMYFADRSGVTIVLGQGTPPTLLAVNQLEDAFSASPALAGDALFLRGERFLYALAVESKPPSEGDTDRPR